MWLELKINISSQYVEPLSDALTEAGASAVTFIDSANEPIYEPDPGTTPLWQQTSVIGLFAADIDAEQIIETLRLKLGEHVALTWHSAPLKEQVWEKTWMDHFEPMKFGENLWVCPSWKAIPDPKAVNILLDPGLAFGTGTHPTTALCLEALSRLALTGKEIIDYGCGSGILAIAGIKLGASKAWCIDNDPQALLATEENAKKNRVEKSCSLSLADAFLQNHSTITVDVLIANILTNPLIALAPQFAKLLKDNAYIVLSGILEHQEQEIIQAYAPWFNICNVNKVEQWLCIEARRK